MVEPWVSWLDVPFDVMFPKLNKRFSASMTGENAPIKGEPRPLNQSEIIDAANKRKDGYEVADQQWLDGVYVIIYPISTIFMTIF